MTFGGERAELQAIEQLEAVVRGIADELAAWRTRALKAESELRELSQGRSGALAGAQPPRPAHVPRGAGPRIVGQRWRRGGGGGPVSTKKHAVKVMIGGEEYTVRSDLPPEYTREVAGFVDQALKKVLSQGPIVETHKAAILAALDITNELFQVRKGEREVAARLAALADDLAKLLPPGKRKDIRHQTSEV